MRTLLLMRHAKSSWDDPSWRDHERPLNERGRRDAPRIGALLAEHGLVPDLILSSTSTRTRETVALLVDALGAEPDTRFVDELYLASPQQLLAAAATAPAHCATVLVVAHNPGLGDLVSHFAGRYERMPTAAVARVEVEVDDWAGLDARTPGTVSALWRPKELD